MNRDATFTPAFRRLAVRCRAVLLPVLCALLPALAPAATADTPAPINLDSFDALKRSVRLPDGETLAYVPMGNPAGAPVVLIHGYTDNARDWVPLIPYLAKDFRLIVVDLRGHGRSGKPDCCYTRLDFAYDVKLLLDALGIERAAIVGHSMGSIVAQTFAEFWPERTQRVVLISSSGGPRPGAAPRPPKFDYGAAIRQLKEPIDPDSKFMVEWWSSPTPVPEDFLRRQRRDAAAIPLRVWLAVLDQGLVDSDLQRTLPRLKAPALLIWGSDDPIMQEEVRTTLREALPHAEVKVFAGLGHNPFWEQPAQCAAVINAFLAAPSTAALHADPH
ncbi:MAG TPA: alpha/beta hydrolase [Steroidobacteraceae bacterium]|nr:alpha/beta hydrolase [Steroidobacteraceae bacterium]